MCKRLIHGGWAAWVANTAYRGGARCAKIAGFASEVDMQDINPIKNQIGDLKGRVESLRGYL